MVTEKEVVVRSSINGVIDKHHPTNADDAARDLETWTSPRN